VSRSLLAYVLQRPWVVRGLKSVYGYFFEEISRIRNANPDVMEVAPMPIRPAGGTLPRINLLLPGISERHVFGGIATALEFLEGFAPLCDNLRIIVTDEASLAQAESRRLANWAIVDMAECDRPGWLVVPAQGRAPLPVGERDVFIATSWWTAHLAREVVTAQRQNFAQAAQQFVYLIQDFEPGFYPWSARYLLARRTYTARDTYVPVFNTSLLRDFLVEQGLGAADDLCFEPVLNDGVKQTLAVEQTPRGRQVLVYGRPTVERNAFPLLVMALRELVAQHDVTGWSFVSVGEQHAPVALGKGLKLSALGKLSIRDYGRELKRSAAGISLMVSPHPSYPPLEMAAAGLWVVTNHYGQKDLSQWAQNIQSVQHGDPQAISAALWQGMQAFSSGRGWGCAAFSDTYARYLDGATDFGALARAAYARLEIPWARHVAA
jgi:O-antigen biosynthesis protein